MKVKTRNNNTTIQSIADELGLSPSTVSRVMNGVGEKYRISAKTIDAVNKTADKLNYSPNQIAKSLRLKKTFTLGLVVPDISNPWFAKIAMKIEEESRKNNYNVFLCNSNDDLKIEKKSVKLLENWKVDGIVLAPIGLENSHLVNSWKKGMPMVLVDRFFEHIDIPYVSTNDYEGAYRANIHLIENGHTNIACFQGIVGTSTNSHRVAGYKKALKEKGIAFREEFILGHDFGFQNGYEQGKKMANDLKRTKVTAVFSVGNQIALGALKAFKEENISVPDDISIISFDDQNYSELLYTPLSTVSHEDERIGEKALKLLLDQIEGKYDEKLVDKTLFPTHLIERDSVKNILK